MTNAPCNGGHIICHALAHEQLGLDTQMYSNAIVFGSLGPLFTISNKKKHHH